MTDSPDGSTVDSPTNDARGTRDLTATQTVAAPPERVYEAFLDPDELAAWLHPAGFTAEIHHLDPVVDGTYRITMQGDTPDTAEYGHTYGGTFDELHPGERIVQTEAPEDPDTDDQMTVTTTFDAVPDGTDVVVTLTIPSHWPDDAIAGWRSSLEHLATHLQDA